MHDGSGCFSSKRGTDFMQVVLKVMPDGCISIYKIEMNINISGNYILAKKARFRSSLTLQSDIYTGTVFRGSGQTRGICTCSTSSGWQFCYLVPPLLFKVITLHTADSFRGLASNNHHHLQNTTQRCAHRKKQN